MELEAARAVMKEQTARREALRSGVGGGEGGEEAAVGGGGGVAVGAAASAGSYNKVHGDRYRRQLGRCFFGLVRCLLSKPPCCTNMRGPLRVSYIYIFCSTQSVHTSIRSTQGSGIEGTVWLFSLL